MLLNTLKHKHKEGFWPWVTTGNGNMLTLSTAYVCGLHILVEVLFQVWQLLTPDMACIESEGMNTFTMTKATVVKRLL